MKTKKQKGVNNMIKVYLNTTTALITQPDIYEVKNVKI